MADEANNDNRQIRDYGNNSHKVRIDESKAQEPRTEFRIKDSAHVRAPSLGRKFRDTFGGDKPATVMAHLMQNVVVPATKNLIFDFIREGSARFLFGINAPARGQGGIIGRTNYNAYSNQGPSSVIIGNGQAAQRAIAGPQSSVPEFDQIVLDSRGDAEEIMENMSNLIDSWDAATVSDLYEMCRMTSPHTYNKYGWTSTAGFDVQPVPQGYLLVFPRPVVLQ